MASEINQGKKEDLSNPKAARSAGTGTQKAAKGARGKKGAGQTLSQVTLAAPGETKISGDHLPRLKVFYQQHVIPALMKEYAFKNPMQVPQLKKVVVNCALKDAVSNPKVLDSAFDQIMAITGQKPVLTRARQAIAAFKVRAGNPVGVMVTLRRARMYEFLDRLMNIALPRVRDFKGVHAQAFDGRGNFSLGVREQIIFPEINYDLVDQIRGFTVTIITSAQTDVHAKSLLLALGMPLKKERS